MKILKNVLKYVALTAYVAIIVFLCIESLKNGESSAQESGAFTDMLNRMALYRFFSEKIPELNSFIRKLFGHYGIYALLGAFGFVVYYSFIKNKTVATATNLSTGLLFSMLTELLQLFTTGRGPSVIDGFVNFSGYISAYCLLYVSWYIINKIRKKCDDDFLNGAKILYSISSFSAIICWLVEASLDQRFCFAIMTVIVAVSVVIYSILMILPQKSKNSVIRRKE